MKQVVKAVAGGIAVGIANVIPGVSGGTLMVIMGIFDRTMNAISNVFKPKCEHRGREILFLLEVLLGAGIGIIGFAAVLKWLFARLAMPTIFWFVGLVALSVPVFKRTQMKDLTLHIPALLSGAAVILVLTAAQVFLFPESGASGDGASSFSRLPSFSWGLCAQLFVSGAVGGFAMLLPGVSGSLMLMIFGVYDLVVLGYIGNLASVFTSFSADTLLSLVPLGFFAVGAVLGIVLSAKLTAFALKKNRRATLSFLLGLVASSVISILCLNTDKFTASPGMIAGSVLAFVLGGAMVLLLGRLQKTPEA